MWLRCGSDVGHRVLDNVRASSCVECTQGDVNVLFGIIASGRMFARRRRAVVRATWARVGEAEVTPLCGTREAL